MFWKFVEAMENVRHAYLLDATNNDYVIWHSRRIRTFTEGREWIVEYADFVEVDCHAGSANLSPQDHSQKGVKGKQKGANGN